MYADCVLTVVLQVEANPQFIQGNFDMFFLALSAKTHKHKLVTDPGAF